MSHKYPKHLTFGFKVLEEIPPSLRPLADDVVACYRRHHADLRTVFVTGSVAVGEWIEGISDLDVVGIVDRTPTAEDEASRRRELLVMKAAWRQVSFIDNSVISVEVLSSGTPDLRTASKARIIAVCGLYLWGDRLDFKDFIPTVETMVRERTARAKELMNKYRSGIANEPFRSNSRLLARSSAKAAIRVLSNITILRGSVFYTSPQTTVAMVASYAPEALPIAQRALAIVNGVECKPHEAMDITDRAIALFSSLYPDLSSD